MLNRMQFGENVPNMHHNHFATLVLNPRIIDPVVIGGDPLGRIIIRPNITLCYNMSKK